MSERFKRSFHLIVQSTNISRLRFKNFPTTEKIATGVF